MPAKGHAPLLGAPQIQQFQRPVGAASVRPPATAAGVPTPRQPGPDPPLCDRDRVSSLRLTDPFAAESSGLCAHDFRTVHGGESRRDEYFAVGTRHEFDPRNRLGATVMSTQRDASVHSQWKLGRVCDTLRIRYGPAPTSPTFAQRSSSLRHPRMKQPLCYHLRDTQRAGRMHMKEGQPALAGNRMPREPPTSPTALLAPALRAGRRSDDTRSRVPEDKRLCASPKAPDDATSFASSDASRIPDRKPSLSRAASPADDGASDAGTAKTPIFGWLWHCLENETAKQCEEPRCDAVNASIARTWKVI